VGKWNLGVDEEDSVNMEGQETDSTGALTIENDELEK
jgi:hypothetical protein